VGLLVATWFGFGSNSSAGRYGRELGYIASGDRHAAYEEMWRREESELWEWLEERVGLERLSGAPVAAVPARKKGATQRSMEEKMREDRMSEREIKEAIRVTEEKLKVLKSVVEKEAEAKASQD
jgi:ABC-type taurine transport system substrate-binding protein